MTRCCISPWTFNLYTRPNPSKAQTPGWRIASGRQVSCSMTRVFSCPKGALLGFMEIFQDAAACSGCGLCGARCEVRTHRNPAGPTIQEILVKLCRCRNFGNTSIC
ncbi:hypothetical protein BDZ94DRAFT_1258062 [Collybia nuda]|uniref:4Fe-4S ferredoxin-type domain-containing protein n=1 Tax=Collybia nuda TaxID=64659 RepID=A0A9P5Y9K8_9AGAR|nr:hypothetical protein BDZ94DRAFT_1258062 [Collybia nuda]